MWSATLLEVSHQQTLPPTDVEHIISDWLCFERIILYNTKLWIYSVMETDWDNSLDPPVPPVISCGYRGLYLISRGRMSLLSLVVVIHFCPHNVINTRPHTDTRENKSDVLLQVATRHYAKLFVVSNWRRLLQQTHICSHAHTGTQNSVYSSQYQSVDSGESVAKRPGFLASCGSASLVGFYCHYPNPPLAWLLHCYCGERSMFFSLFDSQGIAGAKINKGFAGASGLGKKRCWY